MASSTPQIRVPFQAEDFPPGLKIASAGGLPISWDDLLWAAVTVGRPARNYVFQHGDASAYEALFRWSLTRMALQQTGSWASRLRRTEAYNTLDPTEKGSVSYFLGLTLCKLFSTKLLNTPWLLHLDVFGTRYRPMLVGRSRPDLVGLSNSSGLWSVFECKGRGSKPSADDKEEAKRQASRLTKFDGSPLELHVCTFTYFANDILQFYWADPPAADEPFELTSDDGDWQYYYSPIVELLHSRGAFASSAPDLSVVSLKVQECDLRIEVSSIVVEALRHRRWGAAREEARSHASALKGLGFQPDGLRIIAGDSWRSKRHWPIG